MSADHHNTSLPTVAHNYSYTIENSSTPPLSTVDFLVPPFLTDNIPAPPLTTVSLPVPTTSVQEESKVCQHTFEKLSLSFIIPLVRDTLHCYSSCNGDFLVIFVYAQDSDNSFSNIQFISLNLQVSNEDNDPPQALPHFSDSSRNSTKFGNNVGFTVVMPDGKLSANTLILNEKGYD